MIDRHILTNLWEHLKNLGKVSGFEKLSNLGSKYTEIDSILFATISFIFWVHQEDLYFVKVPELVNRKQLMTGWWKTDILTVTYKHAPLRIFYVI